MVVQHQDYWILLACPRVLHYVLDHLLEVLRCHPAAAVTQMQ